MNDINLTNKCGSCNWLEPIEGTCSGYCLRNKYGENVVCDRNHPYWQVTRSRIKCMNYNRKPPTNADHIRSMTDEELAAFMDRCEMSDIDYSKTFCDMCEGQFTCDQCRLDWLKQPYKEEA